MVVGYQMWVWRGSFAVAGLVFETVGVRYSWNACCGLCYTTIVGPGFACDMVYGSPWSSDWGERGLRTFHFSIQILRGGDCGGFAGRRLWILDLLGVTINHASGSLAVQLFPLSGAHKICYRRLTPCVGDTDVR